MTARILTLLVLSLLVCPLLVQAQGGCDTTCGLSEHNREVLLEYLVNNNTAPLEEGALESFFVVTPAGIESLEHVMRTNSNVDVSRAEVFTHRIEVIGDTAVLAGKIVAEGTLGNGQMPELGFLTVYTMVDGEWRLAARSLVPQLAGRPAAQASDSP